jgi:hypothetical protein
VTAETCLRLTHRKPVISSVDRFKPWLRYVMEGPSKMGGMKTYLDSICKVIGISKA